MDFKEYNSLTEAYASIYEEQEEIVEVDSFDLIKEHLMSEGYAETEEAALAIMANMSEDWRKSIIEGNLSYDDLQGLHKHNEMMKKLSPAEQKKMIQNLPVIDLKSGKRIPRV